MRQKIEKMLAEAEGVSFIPVANFETAVREELDKPLLHEPIGNVTPKSYKLRSRLTNVTRR